MLHRESDATANCKAIDLLDFASSSMINDKIKNFPYWLRRRRCYRSALHGLFPSEANGTQKVTGYIAKFNVRTILDNRRSQRPERQTAQVARELDSSGVRRCLRAGGLYRRCIHE